MVIKNTFSKNGFCKIEKNEHFICAFITHSDAYSEGKINIMKRHNDTDEVFVLLEGSATLFTREKTDEECDVTPLLKNTAYTVKASTWHHLATSKDAVVFVTESGALNPENTDTADVSSENIIAKIQ